MEYNCDPAELRLTLTSNRLPAVTAWKADGD
jgi:hypothetical protein